MPRGVRPPSFSIRPIAASILSSPTVPVPWVSTYSDSGFDTPIA